MKKHLLLLFTCFLSVSTPLFSQGNPTPPPNTDGVAFTYDNAGNQTSRDWACLSCTTKAIAEKEKDSIISEINEELAHKIKETKLVAYPNPTTDYLNLEWFEGADKSPKQLQLYSIDSKLLYQRKITQRNGRLEIPVHNYPSGMYILVVAYKDGKNESFKIIKK